MCEVLNNVVNVISGLDGVLEVRQLSNDDILKIIDMEAQRSKDIVPVFNAVSYTHLTLPTNSLV